MLKAFERGLNPCKPTGLPVGPPQRVSESGKEGLQPVLCWATLSLVVLGLSFLADGPLGRLITLQSSTIWRSVGFYISKAGEGWVIALVGAICALAFFLAGRFQASRAIFLVAFTGLLTGAAATIVRSLLGRTRPDSHELQGFYGVWYNSHWIIGKYEFGAFPSGHAATVIGLAVAAWLLDRWFGAVASVYALLVCWSRIALGCHHFSDTVAAGILAVYGANLILLKLGPPIYSMGQHLEAAWLARKAH